MVLVTIYVVRLITIGFIEAQLLVVIAITSAAHLMIPQFLVGTETQLKDVRITHQLLVEGRILFPHQTIHLSWVDGVMVVLKIVDIQAYWVVIAILFHRVVVFHQ